MSSTLLCWRRFWRRKIQIGQVTCWLKDFQIATIGIQHKVTSALRSSSATITMPSICSFLIVLLSFIGSIKASFLREGSTLSVAPRTAYHFTNNYADSSCSQLVNGHMEVRFANTTSFYSKPCTAQESIYGTVYQKEILAEFDKFESCTAGLVGRWRVHRNTLQLCLFSSNIFPKNDSLHHYVQGYITHLQMRLAQLS